MTIQWFPGHMHKTRKLIKENLGKVDVVIELLDARIPFSSRNPVIDLIIRDKPRLIVMNKIDLADKEITKKWLAYFNQLPDTIAVGISCLTGGNLSSISVNCRKLDKNKARIGIRPGRAMIVGIPNVGKSTLINRILGRKKAAVSNKPAVTKEIQRILVSKDFELFDTPGVLWPKFEDIETGINLAIIGSIKDSILNIQEIAVPAALYLSKNYPDRLNTRYKIAKLPVDPVDIIYLIGKNRGFLVSGGNIDFDRTCVLLIQEIRNGKLGTLSFEKPPLAK